MRTPYRASDALLDAWMKRIGREYNASRLAFDELNVIPKVKTLYDRLRSINQSKYRKIMQEAYDDAFAETGANKKKAKLPAIAFLLAILAGYDAVTKYVYDHELERKAARLAEALLAAPHEPSILQEYRRAERLWRQQTKQYAITIEDMAALLAYKDAGITKVRWITAKDERVCSECGSLDGKIFPIDDIPDKPHYGCRCYVTCLLK